MSRDSLHVGTLNVPVLCRLLTVRELMNLYSKMVVVLLFVFQSGDRSQFPHLTPRLYGVSSGRLRSVVDLRISFRSVLVVSVIRFGSVGSQLGESNKTEPWI